MRTPDLAAARGRMEEKGGSEERSEIRDTLFSMYPCSRNPCTLRGCYYDGMRAG